MSTQKIILSAKIPENLADKRLDQAAAELFPQYSRTRLQEWIKKGELTVDEKVLRPRDKIHADQNIKINAVVTIQTADKAQKIALNIIYQDDDIIVINKPAGLVVHPACGNPDKTLLNALLYHAPELKQVPRAGIIHRLDKDTSGIMVVARNLTAQTKLVKALKHHAIEREYVAIVFGVMTGGGHIDAPIGRHPTKRTLMAVVETGKEACTHYRIIERFGNLTYLNIKLETGRTHQIRVHLAHIGYPVVGDKTYGGRPKLPKGASPELKSMLLNFNRQALHAQQLTFKHPKTGKRVTFTAELPQDMLTVLTTLKKNK